jgi:hypothetical protein
MSAIWNRQSAKHAKVLGLTGRRMPIGDQKIKEHMEARELLG